VTFQQTTIKIISNNKGVTLIELLVVITIMMTMVALVAPLTMNTIDKAQAQSEYLTFCGILRKASVKAFSNGLRIDVILINNQLKLIKVPSSLSKKVYPTERLSNQAIIKNFEYLTFPKLTLSFNQNGMPDVEKLTVQQRNNPKELDLIALLEN
jgi:Tfp pilus assembly protein FimT